MENDGLGEGVLGVGIDIHLNNAVFEGLANVGELGAGTAVEDEIHFGLRAKLVHNGLLTVAKNSRTKLHRAGLVRTVYVAEGSGKEETTDGSQGLINGHHVFGSRVKLVGRLIGVIDTVFLTTDDAGFNLKDNTKLGAFLQELGGKSHVLGKGKGGGIQHVGLEQGRTAQSDATARLVQNRTEEGLDMLGLAVVGVKSDEDVVLGGEAFNGFGQNNGSQSGIADGGTGGKLAASDGNLNDTVGLGFRKGTQGAVQDLDGRDVNRGKSISALLSGVQHGTVLSRCGNWHNGRNYNLSTSASKRDFSLRAKNSLLCAPSTGLHSFYPFITLKIVYPTRMNSSYIAIAIDGPAASGKSTVAKRVAEALDFTFINTGAMYRAYTWYILRQGVSVTDADAVAALLRDAPLSYGTRDHKSTVLFDGHELGDELQTKEINDNVSAIAAIPAVRHFLVERQRLYATESPVVMEGRDIGSVVFPDTPFKYYIDASEEVRAARRAAQGLTDSIAERDRKDSSRATAPLVIAEGAKVIDSSNMSIEEVVNAVVNDVRAGLQNA